MNTVGRLAGFLDRLRSWCDVIELDGREDWRRGFDGRAGGSARMQQAKRILRNRGEPPEEDRKVCLSYV
jgi:hypothetical protein